MDRDGALCRPRALAIIPGSNHRAARRNRRVAGRPARGGPAGVSKPRRPIPTG